MKCISKWSKTNTDFFFFLKSSQIIYHHQGNSIKIMEVFNSKKEILCLAKKYASTVQNLKETLADRCKTTIKLASELENSKRFSIKDTNLKLTLISSELKLYAITAQLLRLIHTLQEFTCSVSSTLKKCATKLKSHFRTHTQMHT